MDGGRVLRGLLFYFTKRIRLSTTIAVIVAAITIPVTFHFLLPLNIWSVMIMLLLVLMALTELSFILVRYNDDGSLKELKQ
jgi:Zn-dependent protease